jgi:two-component system cell cycle sensor histidine kinase/response regulator CckA
VKHQLRDLREKEAERRLRESEERYRSLFDKASDGVIIMSPDGKLIEVNESFARMHGYGAGELLRMNIKDLDTPETARLIPDRMRQLLAGEILSFEVEHRHKDGHVFPLEVSAGLISIGGESCLQCFHRDITERKRAEDAGKAHLAFREGIVECAAEGICVCHDIPEHPYVRFTVWNSRMAEITGYPMEEINRLGWYQAVYPDPEVQQRAKDRMDRMRQGDNLKGEDWEITRSDGTTRAISISTSTLQGSGGGVHVLGLFQDITDRKRAEEEKRNLELQVQQAQKMESLGVLAGGVAHDFNNILMAVLGHSELALEEISPMSPARRNLTEISTAARRAADLCRQMLAYAGKASFALERVELRDLVEEMAHLLKTAISKKAILNLNLERGLPPVQADPSQIRQIVMNLIINASEAIGDRSGTITVSVGATRCDEESLRKTELHDALPPGLYMHLDVTDTGVGMDAQTRARIFEPFFSTKFTGRGLGLAAVLGIVRAHKGALKVCSEPGKGTTFRILFPALENGENGARRNDSSPLADWRGKGTILLVDDEEILIALGARMLEHLGFTVLTAEDGLQAVDLYRERGKEIDLVLMDLTMPHMDGAEAFGELRRLNPEVLVVVASGYSPEDVASRFGGMGLAGVLQKPYTLAKLRESLAGLLPKRL